jgi:hypothetical protein
LLLGGDVQRRFAFAPLVIPLVLLAGTDSSAMSATSGEHALLPAFLHSTIRAVSSQGAAPSSPDFVPVGTLVPKADIVARATTTSLVTFGLAVYQDLMHATYPTISTDGGAIWRIDGPCFYVAAAQAASVTSSVGAIDPDGAYFWGRTGNSVEITTDKGARWWTIGFPDGVYEVKAIGRTLRTVALGNQVRGGSFQAFLYISTNSGRTWTFRRQLRNVRF